jgi:cyclopropane fatty-acyl-phospholipid synthase-like methyltransferase
MDNYSKFSQYYDELMGDRTADSEKVIAFIKESEVKGKYLLDIACGTGSTLRYFSDKGYNVTGIDISENMLNIARKKLPNARFENIDMAKFEVNKSFDAITCLYDSVNHLLSFNEWESFFNKSYKHLKEGGIFIFDINTLYKLKKLSQDNPLEKSVRDKNIIIKVSSLPNNIFNWNTQIIKSDSDGSVEKYEENIKETSFEIKKITDVLSNIFKNVKVVDYNGNEPSVNSKRVYFVCRK